MFIESVEIENFRSFLDRQTIRFEPGFNLLVGANNSGKTSLLDLLDLTPLDDPHRSVRTLPSYDDRPITPSSWSVSLLTNARELFRVGATNRIVLPMNRVGVLSDAEHTQVMSFLATDGPIVLRLSVTSQNTWSVDVETGLDLIRGSGEGGQHVVRSRGALVVEADRGIVQRVNTVLEQSGLQAIVQQMLAFRRRIFRFNAQRRPTAECAPATQTELDRDAATLPFWINDLASKDPEGHAQLCAWVRRVLPSVHWVHGNPAGSSFHLRCSTAPIGMRRNDLAISLTRMGSGVGNVIALLYIVLTAREPHVIAIDEPNAFLHPKALRELLAILQSEGKQHQFILTAHSADVLTAVNVKTITLLDFNEGVTTVKQVGHRDLTSVRGELAELGIRMTDLHGKDRVLWVEGASEELVMPSLLRLALPDIAAGTAVLRVEQTGSFERKKRGPLEALALYERLTSSSALVPLALCILLDAEHRSPQMRAQLEQESKGKLVFLDRKMIENYLLDAEAIGATLEELGESIDNIRICGLLQDLGVTKAETDLADLNGAHVLGRVFSDATDARQEFRKTRDVPVLVEWLIANKPEFLQPLRDCLRNKIVPASEPSAGPS